MNLIFLLSEATLGTQLAIVVAALAIALLIIVSIYKFYQQPKKIDTPKKEGAPPATTLKPPRKEERRKERELRKKSGIEKTLCSIEIGLQNLPSSKKLKVLEKDIENLKAFLNKEPEQQLQEWKKCSKNIMPNGRFIDCMHAIGTLEKQPPTTRRKKRIRKKL